MLSYLRYIKNYNVDEFIKHIEISQLNRNMAFLYLASHSKVT